MSDKDIQFRKALTDLIRQHYSEQCQCGSPDCPGEFTNIGSPAIAMAECVGFIAAEDDDLLRALVSGLLSCFAKGRLANGSTEADVAEALKNITVVYVDTGTSHDRSEAVH